MSTSLAPQATANSIAEEFAELVAGDVLVCTTRAGGIERYTVLNVSESVDWPLPLLLVAYEPGDQKLDYLVTYHGQALVGVYGRRMAGQLWWVRELTIEHQR